MSNFAHLITRLRRSQSGLAMTELALAAPLLMTAGLWGCEVAWLSYTHLRISQTALQIADNASRIGDTSTLTERKIYERDINDLLLGANLEAGDSMRLFEQGRVIVSSQEVVPGTKNKQYIRWQRCLGMKDWNSSYGDEGEGLTTNFKGMGRKGEEVTALDEQDAVIFVEIAYDYKPLFSKMFIKSTLINVHGAFNVRDSRDLTQVYQRNTAAPDPVAECDKFTPLG